MLFSDLLECSGPTPMSCDFQNRATKYLQNGQHILKYLALWQLKF